ncbi:MAG TPA: hypothetical protein VHV55_22290 [Pirellulales bacterium]|jgi:hypothetical protein|nr:hypothetical protein [Pirellulales bacterium]
MVFLSNASKMPINLWDVDPSTAMAYARSTPPRTIWRFGLSLYVIWCAASGCSKTHIDADAATNISHSTPDAPSTSHADQAGTDSVEEPPPTPSSSVDQNDADVKTKSLTHLTLDVARALVHEDRPLFLDRITELSPEIARELARSQRSLYLTGLKTLSGPAAREMATHKGGEISLGVTALSFDAAIALAHCDCTLKLEDVTTLSPEVAKVIARHQGPLLLSGVRTISPEAAEALATHKGNPLFLDGLKDVSNSVREVLRANKSIVLPYEPPAQVPTTLPNIAAQPISLADLVSVLGEPDERTETTILYNGKLKAIARDGGLDINFATNDDALLYIAGLFTSRLFSNSEGKEIVDFIDSVGDEKRIGRFLVSIRAGQYPRRSWRIVSLRSK